MTTLENSTLQGWKYKRKLLKAGTTAEQGEKRIRACPREAATFLRDKRKERRRTKLDPA